MKSHGHKAKICAVGDGYFEAIIDGVRNRYLLGSPIPVDPFQGLKALDAASLKNMFAGIMSTHSAMNTYSMRLSFWHRFVMKGRALFTVFGKTGTMRVVTEDGVPKLAGPDFARFLRTEGIQIELAGQDCLVLTESTLKRVEKGGIDA